MRFYCVWEPPYWCGCVLDVRLSLSTRYFNCTLMAFDFELLGAVLCWHRLARKYAEVTVLGFTVGVEGNR